MSTYDTIAALEKVIRELQHLTQVLAEQDDPELAKAKLPEAAAAKANAGICLQCDKPAKKGRKGLCEAHYQGLRRRLRGGSWTPAEAVNEGFMLPPNFRRPGRPPENPMDSSRAAKPNGGEAALLVAAGRRVKARDTKQRKAKK